MIIEINFKELAERQGEVLSIHPYTIFYEHKKFLDSLVRAVLVESEEMYNFTEEAKETEEFSRAGFGHHLPEHRTGKTLRTAKECTAKHTQQQELEEDGHAKRSPDVRSGGFRDEVQHAIAEAGWVVNTQACLLCDGPVTDNAERKP